MYIGRVLPKRATPKRNATDDRVSDNNISLNPELQSLLWNFENKCACRYTVLLRCVKVWGARITRVVFQRPTPSRSCIVSRYKHRCFPCETTVCWRCGSLVCVMYRVLLHLYFVYSSECPYEPARWRYGVLCAKYRGDRWSDNKKFVYTDRCKSQIFSPEARSEHITVAIEVFAPKIPCQAKSFVHSGKVAFVGKYSAWNIDRYIVCFLNLHH